MRIRLAILESDISYLNRISAVFNAKYTDKLEVHSFTTDKNIFQILAESRIDVFLSSDSFLIDIEKVPARCGFAYLVDSSDIESLRGVPVLCKFQKAELIYKQILNIFSENAATITGNGMSAEGKVILFTGASGGVGCSSAAAACAIYFARKGKKAVYLNLETFGKADSYFHGEGQGNFSDIIYAVKSRKANLSLKLESLIKQDATGVFFFSVSNTALDMLELKQEEIKRIIEELRSPCGFDYVILDIDIPFGREEMVLFGCCDDVVLVSDGSDIANGKTEKMIQAIEILEQQEERRYMYGISILYNRFSSRTSQKIEQTNLREAGVIKRFEAYSAEQLCAKLSEMDSFHSFE
jgi:MinD-like ATPase involved in chromosome partitioning or flagellar assembly|nr:chromosome partitioning protein ParA [uncultured Acetatifactor sp.]